MAQNPKYDNDMVNLGYLNKRLGQTEESISKNNSSISQLPKNYSTPPNPPYYKDSLLCYGNKIYRCNNTKLKGEFYWNDWAIVATDDTTISDFINNTYEVEKLEIQEQIDGKIQTHYQENDPSKDWTTDLEKGRHVGDYWYNISDNTQWRYNQITTGPTITYGWGQVNIPKSVFDTIDRKKSIYTAKPTSYKKDDLWIIEETLSDGDLPIGTDENPIAKGDWVFSIADSENYNKEHWVKRDEDVSLSYLEQHYYTITEIDSNLEVIERNTESKITKATEEISLNVSQTYTTKEEHTKAINDFDKQVGTINQTIVEQKETLSDLSVEVGKVSASVESVETKTEELTVDLNGVKKNIIPMSASANSSIYIDDASNNPLTYLEIEGKSTQVTTSGKNIFKDKYIPLPNTRINTNDLTSGTYTLSMVDKQMISSSNNIYIKLYKNGEVVTENGHIIGKNITANYSTSSNNYYFIVSLTYNYITFTIDDSYSLMIGMLNSNDDRQVMLVKSDKPDYEYEEYSGGVPSPNPNYPSEIESVGYENLLSELEVGNINSSGNLYNDTTSIRSKNFDEVKPNLNYIISKDSVTLGINVSEYDKDKIFIKRTYYNNGIFVTSSTTKYVKIQYVGELTDNVQLEEGSIPHPYIPYSKYGVEVKTVGKNLFDNSNIVNGFPNLTIGDTLNYTNSGVTVSYEKCCYVEAGNEYTISYIKNTPASTSSRAGVIVDKNNKILQGIGTWSNSTDRITFTANYSGWLIFPSDKNTTDIQIEEGSATEYTPYQENTTVLELNEPLRSLPNGVKDKAYIRNNKLYVDRYVGSVILNGTEGWMLVTGTNNYFTLVINDIKQTMTEQGDNGVLSNYFKGTFITGTTTNDGIATITNAIRVRNSNIATVDEFKTWLSTNNVQVDYELATPVTEEYGEIEMLKTLKGYNNISTTDELEPVINIEYVRDTVLSNYVEGQIEKVMNIQERNYSELVIEDDLIKESVTEISSNLSDMTEDIHTVQETITSTEKIIDIISTNIDKTTGAIREVTTTTGYTFNADGLDIHKSDKPFHAKHQYDGTYYYDKETIVSETTVDGFMAVKIKNKGSEEYCYDESNKVYDFVKERIEVDGEYGYATFYNGVN